MKRWICLWIAAIAVFAGVALAEDDAARYWTTMEDGYYHADAACGGVETRYPVSLEAAREFEKEPCPVCVAGTGIERVDAVERAGTWVLRVPERALAALPLTAGETDDSRLATRCAGGMDGASDVRLPVTEPGPLLMNLREVGGYCYAVVRPEAPYSDENPIRWRAAAYRPTFFGDAEAVAEGASEVLESLPEISDGGYTQVFSVEYTSGDIFVYRALDANIAVIHWQAVGDPLCVELRIGELPGVAMEGYTTDDSRVFCCVITDTELGALVAGAEPTIVGIEENAEARATAPVPDLTDDAAEEESVEIADPGEALPDGWNNRFFD